MSAVWEIDGLSQSETLVLLALADHADDFGKCWPSIARVAKKARLQRRATQNVIKRLERRGLLTVDRNPSKDGESPNRYQLKVGVHEIHPRGASASKKGCTPVREGVHVAAPKSSLTINEPSEARLKDASKTEDPVQIADLISKVRRKVGLPVR